MHDISPAPLAPAFEPGTPSSVSQDIKRLPVVEETLEVSKRLVDRGGYRLVRHAVEVEAVVDEALRSETVVIERRAVGTWVDGDAIPVARQEGDTFVVPVVEEVLVTEKRLRLVEEVRIRRVTQTHRDARRIPLRQERISIERLGPDTSGTGRVGRGGILPGLAVNRPAGHSGDSMQSTLVGLFDTQDDADHAHAKLIAAGFDASASSVHAQAGTLDGGTDAGLTAGAVPATMTDRPDGQPATEREGVVTRFLHKLFGNDDEDDSVRGQSSRYREAFRRGAYAVTVDAMSDAEIDRAEAILNACGAVDIDERSAQWRGEGWDEPVVGTPMSVSAVDEVPSTGLAATPATALASTGDTTQKLQVVEEELQVGKRVVSRGGVRVFSRIVEVPVQESVELTEEHATIVRRPVDRPATEADLAAFKEGTMELRDTAEEVVVAKHARVVEEVEIGKATTHRDETVHDTVRKTEVEVERVPADETAVGTAALPAGTVSRGPVTPRDV